MGTNATRDFAFSFKCKAAGSGNDRGSGLGGKKVNALGRSRGAAVGRHRRHKRSAPWGACLAPAR